jgi:hypothetical protein
MELANNIREITPADIDSLSEGDRRQMMTAVQHLGFGLDDDSFEQVFEAADDGIFELIDFRIARGFDNRAANWVRFFAGDNETGVVFARDSTQLIAEISDGDVLSCGIFTPARAVCAFDLEFFGVDNSHDLRDFAIAESSVDHPDELVDGDLRTEQILAAVWQSEQTDFSPSLEEAFESVDDGFTILELEVTTEDGGFMSADWVKFHAGDTEVGVVFVMGGTEPIASIGDGDVSGCISAQEALNQDVAAILDEHGLDGVFFDFPLNQLRGMERLNNAVEFEDALDRAVNSFLTDGSDLESPLALVEEEMLVPAGDECLALDNGPDALRCILNQGGSLHLLDYGQRPEGSGDVESDWIFRLSTDFSDHGHWAVVDRSDPDAETFNYGFN